MRKQAGNVPGSNTQATATDQQPQQQLHNQQLPQPQILPQPQEAGPSRPTPSTSRGGGNNNNNNLNQNINNNNNNNNNSQQQEQQPQASTSSGRGSSSGSGEDFGDVSQYRELNAIGTGAYGTVYRAQDLKTDEIVAMKKVRIALTEDGVPMSVLREISLLRHLGKYNHPNIVRLIDICHGPRYDREMVLYLVFEHVDQDLNAYMERCPPPGLSPDKVKDIMWQILCGVDFLHSHRIVHRDIKPQNILVSNNGTVKLADFGLARIYDFNALLTSTVVTLWYRSPEVLLGTSYATPVDIWSCGCIFAELFTRKPLFPGQYEVDQLAKIFSVLGTPSETEWPEDSSVLRNSFPYSRPRSLTDFIPEIDPEAKDLLEKMLMFDPRKRVTAAEALAHPYFAEYGLSPHHAASPSASSSSGSHRRSDISSDSSMNMSHDTSCSSANSSGIFDK